MGSLDLDLWQRLWLFLNWRIQKRRWLNRWIPRRVVPQSDFEDHIKEEFGRLLDLERRSRVQRPTVELAPSGEPWVGKITSDDVGLSLSGGGIRSATFNLGLLQGLDRLELLKSVKYLSTVSGGGYIGGFWSSWLARSGSSGSASGHEPLFPGTDSSASDTPEIRHLREFSRFLSPRIGFFETEMWHAILAFIGGLIPTLTIALLLILFALLLWLAFTTYLAAQGPWVGLVLIVGLAAVLFAWLELMWHRYADKEAFIDGLRANLNASLVALLIVGGLFLLVQWKLDRVWEPASGLWLVRDGSWAAWRDGILLRGPRSTGSFIYLRLFEPVAAWAATGVVFLLARLVGRSIRLDGVRTQREEDLTRRDEDREKKAAELTIWSNAMDRVIMRLLGLALIWLVVVLLWHVGVIISRLTWAGAWTALAAVASGSLFSILRNWLGTAFKQTGHRGIVERVKPLLPMLLSYLTIGLIVICVAAVLAWWYAHEWIPKGLLGWFVLWLLPVIFVAALFVFVLSLDPSDYSLHAFYRERIARAYIGATNGPVAGRAADNRNAEARPDDDLYLDELKERPLHLICCAANDLWGDQVETLARGSRSVTLSKYGVAMGGLWKPLPNVKLGTALTASAAAFNSVMGSVSKKLGPAVTFLMTAFNLRLGLWVVHPAAKSNPDELPGRSLLREFLGLTNAGVRRDKLPEATFLHLSDGGHFDNLGLYELIRRHCRYIIVADSGADAVPAFDDLGNAARRVREDFGVEIEIDLTPLMPKNGRATQHAVVGTVHYDRQYDKGVIIYFKPALVGDEPPDLLQYHTRNTAFPHEGTTDQFYDEAQWESYRRLGFHSALAFFRFAERMDRDRLTADAVFTGARQEWFPTPPALRENVLEMTERFGALEEELRHGGDSVLLAELFPEVQYVGPEARPERFQEHLETLRKNGASRISSELETVTHLLKAIQTMEDVWTVCELDTLWKHPLNVGWVNAFARWATAPSFRRWWPVLAPSFGPGLQRFLREQFYLSEQADMPPAGIVKRCETPEMIPIGLTEQWWRTRMMQKPNVTGRTAYEYFIPFPDTNNQLQVGIVLVKETVEKGFAVATWTSEEFFVPPSLWGGRLGSRFLDKLLTNGKRPIGLARVHVISRDRERSAAYRDARTSFVEFYRSAGFSTTDSGVVSTSTVPEHLRGLVSVPPNLYAWTTMERYG
jgi:hypothetical protein